ncbi:fimbrial protein [Hafnia paralvei]|uniref:fimbrial protein n=1 Tax=Hafnia paralvei TaxID=546367 RepID=UPI003C2C392A
MMNILMKSTSPLLILLLLFFVSSHKVFAEDKLACDASAMITFSGTINAYVSQDNTDLISEGDYILTLPLNSHDLDCKTTEEDTSMHDVYYSLSLAGGVFPAGASAEGQYALLPNSGNAEKLAFMVGYENADGGRNYATSSRLNIPLEKVNEHEFVVDSSLIFSLVSSQGSNGAVPGTYKYSGTLGQVESYDKTTGTYYTRLGKVTLNVTVNLKATTCVVDTDKTIDVRWDALTAKDIINNLAEEKVATIGVTCNDSQTPVKISVASGNGSYDAAGGIAKTSRDNLGLKLTWEDTAQPVNLSAPRTETLYTKSKNYNIIAKPVRYNDGAIALGEFANTVTVNFEYR